MDDDIKDFLKNAGMIMAAILGLFILIKACLWVVSL